MKSSKCYLAELARLAILRVDSEGYCQRFHYYFKISSRKASLKSLRIETFHCSKFSFKVQICQEMIVCDNNLFTFHYLWASLKILRVNDETNKQTRRYMGSVAPGTQVYVQVRRDAGPLLPLGEGKYLWCIWAFLSLFMNLDSDSVTCGPCITFWEPQHSSHLSLAAPCHCCGVDSECCRFFLQRGRLRANTSSRQCLSCLIGCWADPKWPEYTAIKWLGLQGPQAFPPSWLWAALLIWPRYCRRAPSARGNQEGGHQGVASSTVTLRDHRADRASPRKPCKGIVSMMVVVLEHRLNTASPQTLKKKEGRKKENHSTE